ncbi:MAG: pyruvate formate lyase family protein, partial [Planctomycetota bacterium]
GLDHLERPPRPSDDVVPMCFPSYAHPEEVDGLGHAEGASQGHYVPNYPKVMRMGFGGILSQARARLAAEADPTRQDFLRAVCVAFEGAGALALRYAELAESMAPTASAERKVELRSIGAACRHIAADPPQDFHQACQLTFFVHLLAVIENHWLLSQGRMDQYLMPTYRLCDPGEAATLIRCLLIKLNDQGDVRQGDIAYDGEDNVVLGGLLPDGSDGVNELTYALLDALEDVNLPNPEIAARVHRNSPDEYITRLARMSADHFSQLAYFNDDAFVPALMGVEFAAEDARDYVLDACQDVLINGKSSFFLLSAIPLAGIVLEILAEADDAWTFDQLVGRCKQKAVEAIRRDVANYNAQELLHRQVTVLPFLSGTMDDCIENGVDMTQGGLRFRNKGIMVSSPVTAINSLAALRQVVYEQRFVTLSEMKAALAADWQDHEPLRQRCIQAPKWGNDDDAVDSLGKDLIESACREIMKCRTASGARVLAGVHQPHSYGAGLNHPATPDGRHNRDAIPVTLSPANGTDRRGPTAVMKSATKIDPMLCQWNSALLMTFHPSAVRGEAGLRKFICLLKTFFAMGGMQLELNVVDADTLRAAQREPEKHRDLVVRVWGMSARFVELCKGYQDDVIARTEHGL